MLTVEQITEYVLRERLSLTAYISSITRNYHLAEDVYQEICVKVIGREQFRSREHLVNWFRRSARNRAIDVIRAREGRFIGLSPEALALLEEQWDQGEDATHVAAIDMSGKFPSGDTFTTVPEFRQQIINRQGQFTRNLTEKLMTYALGRELGINDRPAIDRILAELEDRDGGLRDLVRLIVLSEPFGRN